ncbi:unnamed protein product [Fusarium fujikuroi]|nr:unnamed protein product [Fusarium fujikuroi]
MIGDESFMFEGCRDNLMAGCSRSALPGIRTLCSVSPGPITERSALNGETGNETGGTTNPSLIKAELQAHRAQAPSYLSTAE